ncbi:MAG: PqqD family protein [Bacteroidales bacterium]|nr:PqqD family protein [Bacteroidales bacterium]
MKIDSKYIMREIAGEKVVVRQGTHGVDMTRIISFNESAAALWEEFCKKEFTAEDAAGFLASRYGIDMETATKDAGNWISRLADCGAIIE